MKTFIEENSHQIKQVFSENNITLHRYMKYPLGEDYYSFKSDDKVINCNDSLNVKNSIAVGSKN